MQPNVSLTDLFSSHGCLVQDRAYRSLSASEAMVAFLYIDQAKSHSFTPPAAIALQYTVTFKLGVIQEALMDLTHWMDEDKDGEGKGEQNVCGK